MTLLVATPTRPRKRPLTAPERLERQLRAQVNRELEAYVNAKRKVKDFVIDAPAKDKTDMLIAAVSMMAWMAAGLSWLMVVSL